MEMEQEVVQEEKKEKSSDETEKVFNLYSVSDVEISDPGLKNIINLDYKLILKSHGRKVYRFEKTEVNIIERLINLISVPGHRGKKHKVVTNWASGKYNRNARTVLAAFELISKKTGKNPVQVLVSAVEKAAPRDEITTIQYGGARYPQAVDCAPYRRVSIALRNIVHGSYDKAFNKKKTIAEALADEIIASSNEAGDGFAYVKRNEVEKQADGAR